MGSPAALLLPILLLLTGLPAPAGKGCPCRPPSSRSDQDADTEPVRGRLPVQRARPSRRQETPLPAQRKFPSRCRGTRICYTGSVPWPGLAPKNLRSRRTWPWDPGVREGMPRPDSLMPSGAPEFTFDWRPETQTIRVTVPPGPEVSVRLCHQWVLECEEPSSPFDAQEIVSGGQAVDLHYEFLLPCLCIEASYLQEDTIWRKKCPFRSWPEAYGPGFWQSVRFTDHSRHAQMVMAATLRCPVPLEATLCQRQGRQTPCEDLPNATAQETDGLYVLEKVDLHPDLCFKFSCGNSSHVECPHPAVTTWNVSLDTRAQQLLLHFSSQAQATFSATWSQPGPGDSSEPPVYSVSQTQGSSSRTLDLIVPSPWPGACILVWRSDVQFARKHRLCPDVSHRRLGMLVLALLAAAVLLGLGLALTLTHRRPLTGPVLLLHAAESGAQRRLAGAVAELLRAGLRGRAVLLDLGEARGVAGLGPGAWLWAAGARVARERGAVLLLWTRGPGGPRGPDPRLLPRPGPRPLLAHFGRLCARADLPPALRALPRHRLPRDLRRLLRALGAPRAPGPRAPGLRACVERCRRLAREAAGDAGP